MEQFPMGKRYPYFIAGILVFFGLYLTSLYNYLLFHSLAEIFSIVVACGIFIVTWNSRHFLDNNYLLFLGIAYLFIGGLDLIHALTYKGMGIFQGYGTNLATQLWIAARYTESLSLLIAPLFIRRKLKINLLFFTYTLVLSLFLISIFYWNIFPTCFVEGVGLTPFKKISEYIISIILLASIAVLFKNRSEFDRDVLRWVVWSVILTIASELAFTFYIEAYGFSNLLGHFFKIASFYLIYKALIEMGLTKPYRVLFRNLKRSEMMVREEKNKIQNYLDISGVILVVIDANQTVSLINKKGCQILGYEEKEVIGNNWFDTFIPEGIREEVRMTFKSLMKGETNPVEYFENPVLTKTGEERMVAWHNAVLRDEKGNGINTLSSGEDITDRKQAEEAIKASEKRAHDEAARLQAVLDTAPAIIWIARDRECREITGNRASHVFLRVSEGTDMSKSGWAPERLAHYRVFKDGVELTAREMPIQRVAASGQGLTDYTMELVFNDGTARSVLGNISPVLDSEGQPNGAIAAFIDITDRKKVEEELRRSRDELELRVQERTTELANAYKELKEQSTILESFFKYTVTPLVLLDRDFNFIRVNEAYAEACQREASEFPGHNHFEFYPSDAKAKFEQVVQTKEPYVAIARPFTFPDHPERGTTYWDWILTPLLDDAGEVEFLVLSLEDVTERKHAEQALHQASLYNRSLIEASLDPLVTIDKQGKVTDVNSATELATGVPRERLIGSDFSDYFTDPKKARQGYLKVFSKGTVRDYPLAIRHRSGMITDVLYNATLYRNAAGEIQGIVAAARDITERKRAEDALRESENRLRVLSSQLLTAQESERKRIAVELHDGIGQMLTAIKFKVESTLTGKSKTRGKEKSLEAIIPMVRESVEEVRRMQMDLRPSTLDDLGILATLDWFCREYQKIYSHIHIEKEIGLQESDVSPLLRTAIYRLTQEAMNNIAKHSQADLIHLSLRRMENKIELFVRDNGTGFNLEEVLSLGRSERGLGLDSMRERTELSGGTFIIESTPGKGTTVRASWPV
jgi:PAS domain S-box-containing protein